MPDEEAAKKKSGIFKKIFNKNLYKRFLRRNLGIKVHYTKEEAETTKIPTFKESPINFGAVGELNKAMVAAENWWDGTIKGGSATEITKEIINLYVGNIKGEEGEINHAIGPFTSLESVEREGLMAEYGAGINENTETLKIKIKQADGTEEMYEGKFSVPKEREIRWPEYINEDGELKRRSYKVGFIGYKNQRYWGLIESEINEICEYVKNKRISGLRDNDPKRALLETYLGQYVPMYIDKHMKQLAEFLQNAVENEHRGSLIGEEGVSNLLKTGYPQKNKDTSGRKLSPQQIYYHHTYFVTMPDVFEIDNHTEEYVTTYLKDNPGNFWKKPNEIDWGLDENGWPLEVVGPEKYEFEGETYREGTVLLDIFEKHEKKKSGEQWTEPRIIPKKFIRELDLIEKAPLIQVHWDSYRDDLRDGRYHPKSRTIMQQIMKELDSSFLTGCKYDDKTNQAIVEIKSNRGGVIIDKIKPSHLNPAFDMSLVKSQNYKTIHIGRKLYYATQSNPIPTSSDEPTITTRGASLYMLHRSIEEIKHWDAVIEFLEAVGGHTQGYDIGPNLGRWGKELTRNPFRPV